MILKYWTTSKGVRYMHRLVCSVFECEYQMQPGYGDVSHYVARNYVRAIQTNDFIPSVLFHLCTLRHPDSLWAPAALNPASHIPPSLHLCLTNNIQQGQNALCFWCKWKVCDRTPMVSCPKQKKWHTSRTQ